MTYFPRAEMDYLPFTTCIIHLVRIMTLAVTKVLTSGNKGTFLENSPAYAKFYTDSNSKSVLKVYLLLVHVAHTVRFSFSLCQFCDLRNRLKMKLTDLDDPLSL